jgi:ribosomal protein S18 acetylase RimI-like enzyme
VNAVTELVIRPLDPRDDADMDAFQDVYAAAERAEDPDTALFSRADGVAFLSAKDGGYFCDGFGAFIDGRMVGELMVNGSVHDNLDLAHVWVWVHPDASRQGVGSELATFGEEYIRSLGRHVCLAHTRLGADLVSGGRRFLERLGYALANTEVERRLALPVEPALLDRLEAEAAPLREGYQIRVAVGAVPDDLAASYVVLRNLLMVEIPSGDVEMEEGRDTVDDLAAQQRQLEASGRQRLGAYAVDPDGNVAGYTIASAALSGTDHVDQWGTIVHPSHRGRRLGLALKCAQLRAVPETFPGKTYVSTTNAETNAHMVAINEGLGFEVYQVHGDFQKLL